MSTDKYKELPAFHFSKTILSRYSKKNPKCVIFGNFGAMNLGDEAILAGQIQELRKIPNIGITVAARFPEEVKRLHHVNAMSMYNFHAIRKSIKKSDFVIVGGGGLINKVERSIFGFLYQLYMLFTFFFLPRFYKKKLYVLGVGIYDNANPFIVNIVVPLLRGASIITVRDHHSFDFLKSKQIHAAIYKDNSFLMNLLPVKEVLQDPFVKEHYRSERWQIGISLVKPVSGAEERHLVREMAKFVVSNAKKSDFWFFPADSNPSYETDSKIMKKVLMEAEKHTKDPIVMYNLPTTYTPQLFFSAIKLMHGMISMRLHTSIFAYRCEVPFAGISYDEKCSSFIEAIGKKPLRLKNFKSEDLNKSIL
ncbi:MAG TPA: polysaccharide pyruvyl transferase family protein [Candidatus Acidoferrales bacterium]|nr:polysaccharide pyruvyl transferase family protein [Candidatus Acidoferrales bacterium]